MDNFNWSNLNAALEDDDSQIFFGKFLIFFKKRNFFFENLVLNSIFFLVLEDKHSLHEKFVNKIKIEKIPVKLGKLGLRPIFFN